ncbi:hypothetical protein FRB93_013876 [Tulasnella sp. JGI-2019a]|nr:hypothetical protein FRB93_013876 [Tulasnella sp. JGI-2019a]
MAQSHVSDECTWSKVLGVLAIPHKNPNLRRIKWSHYESFPPIITHVDEKEDDPEEEDTSNEAVDGDEEMEAETTGTSAPTPSHSQ